MFCGLIMASPITQIPHTWGVHQSKNKLTFVSPKKGCFSLKRKVIIRLSLCWTNNMSDKQLVVLGDSPKMMSTVQKHPLYLIQLWKNCPICIWSVSDFLYGMYFSANDNYWPCDDVNDLIKRNHKLLILDDSV